MGSPHWTVDRQYGPVHRAGDQQPEPLYCHGMVARERAACRALPEHDHAVLFYDL
jgi:hypothetical protein